MLSTMRRVLSGDMALFGAPALDEATAGRVRAEQIGTIKRYLPWMMLANICNALTLVAALWPSPDRYAAMAWASLVVAFAALHGVRARRRVLPPPQSVSARTVLRATRNAFLLGSIWAVLPLAFFASASSGGQLIITCLCAGMLSGGAFAFACLPVAAIAFTGPIFVASAISIARSGDPAYFLVAVLMVVYTSMLLRGVFVHALQLTSRLAAQIKVEDEARRDALTGLPNRIAFEERIERAFAPGGGAFALLYLDLNELKSVNDKLGRTAGNEFLVRLTARFAGLMEDGDTVFRIGGDEFALIAASATTAESARDLAERLLKACDAPLRVEKSHVQSTVSIGVAMAPVDGADAATLLRSADVALYHAKRGAGGAVQFYDPRHDAKARARRALEQDLRVALERQEFHLVFQPLLDLASDRITGCEALLRWRHPSLGLVPPSDFIPIAEETGLIGAIGKWAVREACRVAATWPGDLAVSVNFSAIQLREVDVLPTIVNALADARLAPARLEVEITESVVISESGFALALLRALRHLGVRIALDDFGTGYSSLSYLRKLPLDSVKIDHSFVRDMIADPACASIVKSVIALARDLGISVTAEGVETAEQLSQLRAMGCAKAQGYLISEPKAAAAIASLLREHNGSLGLERTA